MVRKQEKTTQKRHILICRWELSAPNFDSLTFFLPIFTHCWNKSIWLCELQLYALHCHTKRQPLITLLICKTNSQGNKLSLELLCNAETMSNLILLHFSVVHRKIGFNLCLKMCNKCIGCISLIESAVNWNRTSINSG